MMPFNKINNYAGWFTFAVSFIVYALTVEPTASFWDCGEFIAVSYKLQVPHPPGAPFYLLIGRMFSFFAFGDVTQVAYWINMASVISSAFTILFLYWTIVLLGRKLLKIKLGEETEQQAFTLIGAGLIGALAYTFSDSFWFSAVEAEVYAMSSFFTAFVFWAILKWELIEDESKANRWLILIAYMVGLSIGVHLLNLVTLPALAIIVYFKLRKDNIKKEGIWITLGISAVIIVGIMSGVITGLPIIAGSIEIFFVNSLGMPFGSGIIVFAFVFVGGIVYGIIYSVKKNLVLLNTALLCFSFLLIGYSSYTIVIVRSNYNPLIDENNPENIISFVSYLKREQYGSRSLFKGPYFDAEVESQERGAPIYVKGEDKYEISDYKIKTKYNPKQTTLLPRMYSSQGNHPDLYRQWAGLRPGQSPTFTDNIKFLFSYQMGHMYFRYFMWNFFGRESDIEGAGYMGVWENSDNVPETIKKNKGRNNYFAIPFILGLLGLIFQANKDKQGFLVVGLLFLCTGAALVLYINSPPVEPRERDYIYVGSFYAFAIWIGFSVISMVEFLKKYGFGSHKLAPAAVTGLCLLAPVVMAIQGWDDHDRSNRYFSVDSARNYLNGCADDAVLFTGGDNDTFPLWYVQEVEGEGIDKRVVVLSYFNTDWYIDQLKRKAYESEPIPFSFEREHYKQGTNDYLPYVENKNIKELPLELFLGLLRKHNKSLQVETTMKGYLNIIPHRTITMQVDTTAVKKLGIIPEDKLPFLTSEMRFQLKGSALEKKDLMLLDFIVTNKWKRPIYFNSTSLQGINIDLRKYVIQEGNVFRLLPIENPNPYKEFINTDLMYENVTKKFAWRELNNPDVYYTDDYRKSVFSHRASLNTLADALLVEGKTEKAREIIEKSLEWMPDDCFFYDYTSSETVRLLYELGEKEKAKEMAILCVDRSFEMLKYLTKKGSGRPSYEIQTSLSMLSVISRVLATNGEEELAEKYYSKLGAYQKYFQ